ALSRTIYEGPADRSAEAVAAALADGIHPEAVGEAISLASNLLTLRQGPDNWRTHGASAGVHSSDATNSWRNMARVTDSRHAVGGLIVAAYHSALIKTRDAAALLAEAEDAVRHNDQGRATAAIQIYGENGHAPEPVFNL